MAHVNASPNADARDADAAPSASIVVPTRDRPAYLEVTLRSLAGQTRAAEAELIVIDDGTGAAGRAVAERHGATVLALGGRGLNVARNTGVRAARSDLVVLVDDDVEAPPGWLAAILAGARQYPEHGVFGGPIQARLEGGGPRACGREPAPISTLDLGGADRDAELVWGANMAVRRGALELAGPFDEQLNGRGDEEEWEQRYRAAGGRIRYLAAAGLEHRRTREDARLRRLCPAAYSLGRTARRNDIRKHLAPSPAAELRTLAGCVWHIVRRRCAIGFVLTAHSLGRVRETIAGGSRA
jgi:glycosyltransferase involved in cell wall biosynthesis